MLGSKSRGKLSSDPHRHKSRNNVLKHGIWMVCDSCGALNLVWIWHSLWEGLYEVRAIPCGRNVVGGLNVLCMYARAGRSMLANQWSVPTGLRYSP